MSNKNEHSSEQCIWLVRGHKNSRGWMPIESAGNEGFVSESTLKAIRQTKVGWFLPQNCFPTDCYPRPDSKPGPHLEPVPQIFSNGFIMLAGESAEVVQSFDMGEGALYPVRLWHPDRETQVPGDFFYLSQGNKKDAFLRELSEGFDQMAQDMLSVHWRRPKPAKLVFSKEALGGPDLWWDETIYGDFFISDRLKRALDERGLSADWHLMRCSISSGD